MMSKEVIPDITSPWQRIDDQYRPQDDLFSYVNASWLAANPIPASESRWGTFDVLRQQSQHHLKSLCEELLTKTNLAPESLRAKIRNFYQSGMSYDQYEAQSLALITDLFDELAKVSDLKSLSSFIGKLHAYQIEAPWETAVEADDKDSQRHVLRLHQGGLTLPNRDYYLEEDAKYREIRQQYRQHIERIYNLLPALGSDADAIWQTISSIETDLAKHSATSVELRDVEATYNPLTYTQLQANYPHIDWPAYAAASGWQPADNLVLSVPKFLKHVDHLFSKRPLDDWRQYLRWQIAIRLLPRVSERFAAAHFEFFGKVLGGRQEMMPLWRRVLMTMNEVLGEAVGQLYVEKHFPESSKQQMLQLVENVRDTYAERIQRLDWMSDKSKHYALKKLKNIKVLVGFPDLWRNYDGFSCDSPVYLENLLHGRRHESDFYLSKLSQPVSRDDWFMTPQTVNAYHDPNRLVICFPAAILQPPFFAPDAHYAQNIGGIGTVIAHELTHGFDDQGSQFDAEGNVRNWLTKTEKQAFEQRAQIIAKAGDNFEVLPGLKLQGQLILGEAIADLGGIDIAYEALRRHQDAEKADNQPRHGLTPDELFFIGFASTECDASTPEILRQMALIDPHPVSQFRVNVMASLSDAFAAVYHTKPTDKLYIAPADQPHIW